MHGLNISKLYRIFENYDLPDYVKKASDYEAIKQLYSTGAGEFADPVHKKYLCADEVTTILSACDYFNERDKYTKEQQELIENNFRKIASLLAIEEDYLSIEKQAKEKDKNEIFFAVRVTGLDGKPVDCFPVRNEKEANESISYIWRNWREIAPEIRKVAAENILNYCEEKNYHLTTENRRKVEALARKGAFDFNGFNTLCQLLKVAAERYFRIDSGKSMEYQNLSKVGSDYSSILPEDIDRVMDAVQEIAGYIPTDLAMDPPEGYLYISTSQIKTAMDSMVKLSNGYIIDEYSLLGISKSLLRECFSDEELESLLPADFVPSLADYKKFASNLNVEQADRFVRLLLKTGRSVLGYISRKKEIPS